MDTREKILLSVSRETAEKLEAYEFLLKRWQKKINLISNNSVNDMWQRHFLDSIQLSNIILSSSTYNTVANKEKNISKYEKIVDIGSGAGFPGMVLAILGFSDVHLVESDRKKSLFLSELSRRLSIEVSIHNERLENIIFQDVRVFVSRACAPIAQLLKWSEKNISNNTICCFHKGREYDKEIKEVKKEWNSEIILHSSVTDKQSVIVELKKNKKKIKFTLW